jgi:hypothetical protein
MQNPIPHSQDAAVSLIKKTNKLYTMSEKLYTRRQSIGLLASMAIASSCMPMKIIFNTGKELEKNYQTTLRAFTEVIIPEAQADEPGLTDVFYDEYYPFLKYIRILSEDLDKVSKKEYQTDCFSDLSLTRRTEIVDRRMTKYGISSAVYLAAVYLIQLSYFTGIYNPDKGCDLIGFQCEDQVTDSYEDIAYFEGDPATPDGNPS